VVAVIVAVVGVPVMARVAVTVISARTARVTSIPVTFRAPMAVTSVIDLLDGVSLHLRGFRHENGCGA
jgi:hypothetical protein